MGRAKPPLPSCLRGDGPCFAAPPGAFEIPPRGAATPAKRRARRYQVAVAQSFCNGVPGRPGCRFKLQCLTWALRANELGVYGGIEVTSWVQKNRDLVMRREIERAAETQAPSHETGQLAERHREAG